MTLAAEVVLAGAREEEAAPVDLAGQSVTVEAQSVMVTKVDFLSVRVEVEACTEATAAATKATTENCISDRFFFNVVARD